MKRPCTQMKPFSTRGAARLALKRMREQHRTKMIVDKCDHCGNFHLVHLPGLH